MQRRTVQVTTVSSLAKLFYVDSTASLSLSQQSLSDCMTSFVLRSSSIILYSFIQVPYTSHRVHCMVAYCSCASFLHSLLLTPSFSLPQSLIITSPFLLPHSSHLLPHTPSYTKSLTLPPHTPSLFLPSFPQDCGSSKSVAQIRAGYHAETRADRRAQRNA